MYQECEYSFYGISKLLAGRGIKVSHQTIANWVKRAGIPIRPVGKRLPSRNQLITVERKNKIIGQAMQPGVDLTRLAHINSIAVPTIYRWVSEEKERRAADEAVKRMMEEINKPIPKPVLEPSSIRPPTKQELMCGRVGGFCPLVRAS